MTSGNGSTATVARAAHGARGARGDGADDELAHLHDPEAADELGAYLHEKRTVVLRLDVVVGLVLVALLALAVVALILRSRQTDEVTTSSAPPAAAPSGAPSAGAGAVATTAGGPAPTAAAAPSTPTTVAPTAAAPTAAPTTAAPTTAAPTTAATAKPAAPSIESFCQGVRDYSLGDITTLGQRAVADPEGGADAYAAMVANAPAEIAEPVEQLRPLTEQTLELIRNGTITTPEQMRDWLARPEQREPILKWFIAQQKVLATFNARCA